MRRELPPPNATTASAVALAVGALLGWLGSVAVRRFAPLYADFESDDDDVGGGVGATDFYGGEETKMVFCVRTDLKMTKGKTAAQVGHATLGAFKRARRHTPAALRAWEANAQPKICLAINSAAQARALCDEANRRGLNTYTVHDAGRTQIAAGSLTVLAIGPAPKSAIDVVTGHLRLL